MLSGGITRLVSNSASPPIALSIVLTVEPGEFNQEQLVRIRSTTPSGAHPVNVEGTIIAKGDPDSTDGLPHYVSFQLPLSSAELLTELGTHTFEVGLAGEKREVGLRVSHPLEPVDLPRVDVEIDFREIDSRKSDAED